MCAQYIRDPLEDRPPLFSGRVESDDISVGAKWSRTRKIALCFVIVTIVTAISVGLAVGVARLPPSSSMQQYSASHSMTRSSTNSIYY